MVAKIVWDTNKTDAVEILEKNRISYLVNYLFRFFRFAVEISCRNNQSKFSVYYHGTFCVVTDKAFLALVSSPPEKTNHNNENNEKRLFNVLINYTVKQ
jgi:hypothetical protein